ncbi:MAG: Pilus assembly protein PilO [Patescibacteria group bacterium]|nr:Pilus assembly protein PilO [Patescibacteria group bacterium]
MEKKQINLIISLVILLLIFGLFNFLILPEYRKIGEKNLEIERLEKQIEITNNYYLFSDKSFNDLMASQWDQKKELITINFMSSPFFFPKTQYFLRNTASQNGLMVSNITNSHSLPIDRSQEPFKDKIEGPVKKTSFNVSLEGTYESLKNFLSALESQTRLANVKSISTSSMRQKSDILKFSLIIDFYSY